MSKKEVEVHLADKTDRHGNDFQELMIGKKIIGEIRTVAGKIQADSFRKTVYHAKSLDEAVQLLLSEYNLHK